MGRTSDAAYENMPKRYEVRQAKTYCEAAALRRDPGEALNARGTRARAYILKYASLLLARGI